MVRDAYDPEAAEARRRAVALHAAVVTDAQNVPALAELMRCDALSRTAAVPASISLGLVAPPLVPLSPDPRKEAVRVLIPSRTVR